MGRNIWPFSKEQLQVRFHRSDWILIVGKMGTVGTHRFEVSSEKKVFLLMSILFRTFVFHVDAPDGCGGMKAEQLKLKIDLEQLKARKWVIQLKTEITKYGEPHWVVDFLESVIYAFRFIPFIDQKSKMGQWCRKRQHTPFDSVLFFYLRPHLISFLLFIVCSLTLHTPFHPNKLEGIEILTWNCYKRASFFSSGHCQMWHENLTDFLRSN